MICITIFLPCPVFTTLSFRLDTYLILFLHSGGILISKSRDYSNRQLSEDTDGTASAVGEGDSPRKVYNCEFKVN